MKPWPQKGVCTVKPRFLSLEPKYQRLRIVIDHFFTHIALQMFKKTKQTKTPNQAFIEHFLSCTNDFFVPYQKYCLKEGQLSKS